MPNSTLQISPDDLNKQKQNFNLRTNPPRIEFYTDLSANPGLIDFPSPSSDTLSFRRVRYSGPISRRFHYEISIICYAGHVNFDGLTFVFISGLF